MSRPTTLLLAVVLVSMISSELLAAVYTLPPQDVDLIGRPQTSTVKPGETLLDVARRFAVGQLELLAANPGVPRWTPPTGLQVQLPTQIILPDVERTGAALNLAEMRLYYFQPKTPDRQSLLTTCPVSIGQIDWHTPLGKHTIVRKRENPSWTPPESIHREAQEMGRSLPRVVPAGPNNPLGDFALNLDRPGYQIHGTNQPYGIGMRVTHGCVRLYPEDIKEFYQQSELGTLVNIIHQPVKLGWYGGQLFLEVHPPLKEFYQTDSELFESTVQMVLGELREWPVAIKSHLVRQAVTQKNGLPVRLSLNQLPR